jgi:nucleotide-binding universal stress UspA family protein
MLFKNILVPYDGSHLSEEALRLALEIAKMTGNSKVSLLSVIEEIPLPPARFNMKFHSTKTGEGLPATAYFKELYGISVPKYHLISIVKSIQYIDSQESFIAYFGILF